MAYDPLTDDRLDPRNKALLSSLDEPLLYHSIDVGSREEALTVMNSPEAVAKEEAMLASMEIMDDEAIFPSQGLQISRHGAPSTQGEHSIPIKVLRPDNDETLPCVLYIHGGAMMSMSFEMATYRAWSKALAHTGVCVAMVDFRNSLRPSTAVETAPYPAGLDDCVDAYVWVQNNLSQFNIAEATTMIAGDSGGGNLAIATTMKLVRNHGERPLGLYALCPYILGKWPDSAMPSSSENEGVLISVSNNIATMGYGISHHESRDPMAWPSFASLADVAEFPPTMISINECDPLRDEGLSFYRLLLKAGVRAHCRQMMGTVHANEMFTTVFPELTRMTARDIRGWIEECIDLKR